MENPQPGPSSDPTGAFSGAAGHSDDSPSKDGQVWAKPAAMQLEHAAFAHLAELEAALTKLDATIDEISPVAVFDAIERFEHLTRRTTALRARLMARAHHGGLWSAKGMRSFASWMTTSLGADPTEVGKTVREASAVDKHLPEIGKAARNGEISWAHVSAVVRRAIGSDKQIAALKHPKVGETFLLEQAQEQPVPKFRQLMRVWADRADPDAGDARWQKDAAQEYLVLAKTLDGYHLQGWLSEVNGKTVAEAINAAIGTPAENDTRSMQERNAHGLTDIAHTVLSSGVLLKNATVRPHISVTVEYQTLRKLLDLKPHKNGRHGTSEPHRNHRADGFGGVDGVDGVDDAGAELQGLNLNREPVLGDGTYISRRELEFLSCDSTVSRIVFGPKSEVLDVGRKRRTVTPQQRKAVQARDRTCQYPGCGAAPYTIEVHHIQHWAAGGETSVNNSILLCRYHHQHVHQRKIEIYREKNTWHFYDSDGQALNERKQYKRAHPPDNRSQPRRENYLQHENDFRNEDNLRREKEIAKKDVAPEQGPPGSEQPAKKDAAPDKDPPGN